MRKILLCTAALLALTSGALAAERVGPIQPDRFRPLQAMIKPRPGESPWRKIAWFTNVTEARRKAAAEGKPMVIFTAADGSPLSRT